MSRRPKGTRQVTILAALAERPHLNAELCELLDDIGSYVSRTMAALHHRGLTRNAAVKKGRGSPALYVITPLGREFLKAGA